MAHPRLQNIFSKHRISMAAGLVAGCFIMQCFFVRPVREQLETAICLEMDARQVAGLAEGEAGGSFASSLDQNHIACSRSKGQMLDYAAHSFFGESLHLEVASDEVPARYQLLDADGGETAATDYSPMANGGIRLGKLAPGEYAITLDGKLVSTSRPVAETWHTVTRKGQACEVRLYDSCGLLFLGIREIQHLPADVFDILVDPGHGGMDGGTTGNGLVESHEALKLSRYMAKRLSDHGLKVRLTRSGDYEPAKEDRFHYIQSPYYEEGRVEQVYRYQAKYVVTNHLNASGFGTVSGFEIYSSIYTDDQWSREAAAALEKAGQQPRDSQGNGCWVSTGSYKKGTVNRNGGMYGINPGCPDGKLDFLYLIREAGGTQTFGSGLRHFNPDNYPETPNYGAEVLLVEYAYLDHPEDAKSWLSSYKEWGEAIVKATVVYLGIPYDKY